MPGTTPIAEEIGAGAAPPELPAAPSPKTSEPWWKRVLTARSPDKPIEAYRQHPWNWDGSEPVGRLIRGMTGILGNLDFAIADVFIGLAQLTFRRPGGGPPASA